MIDSVFWGREVLAGASRDVVTVLASLPIRRELIVTTSPSLCVNPAAPRSRSRRVPARRRRRSSRDRRDRKSCDPAHIMRVIGDTTA